MGDRETLKVVNRTCLQREYLYLKARHETNLAGVKHSIDSSPPHTLKIVSSLNQVKGKNLPSSLTHFGFL
jgi:hypothetical protein